MSIMIKRDELIASRLKKGYSQRKLAKITGLSSSLISQIENCTRNPSPYSAKKICEALNVEFKEIFLFKNVTP